MNNEMMKDDERAAFEAWASEALEAHYDEQGSLQTYDSESAWLGWQARATSPQSGEGEEPYDTAHLLASPANAERLAQSIAQFKAAQQAALSDEQILEMWGESLCVGNGLRDRVIQFARALLTQALTERMSDTAREEKPSLTNPLTPYGMLVRALRIVAGTTLMDMAKFLGRGPAALSSLEFGRKPVTNADIVDATHYFASFGIHSTTHALTIAARKAKIESGEGKS